MEQNGAAAGPSNMAYVLYLLGSIVLITGLAAAATALGVAQPYVLAGAATLLGLALGTAPRFREPRSRSSAF